MAANRIAEVFPMGKIFDALERSKKDTRLEVKKIEFEKIEKADEKDDEKNVVYKPFGRYEVNQRIVVAYHPESIDAENFKILRGQILFAEDNKKQRTIMVTSAFPGEGKTFVAGNLAASIALGIDEYVLMVDCDLRRPGLHSMFGYTRSAGLYEYLTGQKRLEELLIKTKIPKLSLLAAGRTPQNPSELLSSKMMENFLEEVKGRYSDRYIIIDSTPSQITAEANVLAKHVDGVIVVVMAQKSPKKAIQRTIESIGREKIIGIVFNGHKKAHKEYHKYYKKYYN